MRAQKITILKLRTLRCTFPYALEGLMRRELEIAAATLLQLAHGEQVSFDFSFSDAAAAPLLARLDEAGHGRITWFNVEDE